MVHAAYEVVTQHLWEMVSVVAVQGEFLEGSNESSDRFTSRPRMTVEVKPLHNRGGFGIVIILKGG